MKPLRIALLATATCAVASVVAPRAHPTTMPLRAWNSRAAAAYLDGRMTWWLGWTGSARDHETSCISCHTALPFALARPALRTALAEREPAAPERRMLDNVVKRVRLWREVEPFYADQTRGLPKTSESRGTEAIFNALILARRDAESGTLGDDARQAFANLWPLQFKAGDLKGAWAWLNFHNEPWEANGSAYFGATLAAIAIGSAPGRYAASPEIQDRVKLLEEFLQRGADTTVLFNRVMVLWASGHLPAVLTASQRQGIIDSTFTRQQPDGGWSTSALGPYKRGDGTALDTQSDGLATGMIALALQRAGVARSEAHVRRGLDWLMQHQDAATGMWLSSSLNKSRDPATDIGKFMSDAATAYAVLALTQAP